MAMYNNIFTKQTQEYTRKCRTADVERIERAILLISERIQRPSQGPVSKAQAEAKEELLRVRLAQMILNLDPDFEPAANNGGENGTIYETDSSKRQSRISMGSAEVPMDDKYYGQV
jgi:hypothetical protein